MRNRFSFFRDGIKDRAGVQYLLGVGSVSIVALICNSIFGEAEYHVVALILLLVVSILAMFLDVLPIISAAVMSALLWNFLFIPPEFTFSISTPQDALLFLMYFVIAVINGFFTSKIRKMENISNQRKEREKTLELYNTLFNSLSHELKTPIATIIGSVDVLKNNREQISTEVKEDIYNEIEIASQRLNRQVEHFLDMSRLDSDYIKIQPDWYDLDEIIHLVINANWDETSEHSIVLVQENEIPLLKIDGPLVEQILYNIVHNAVQYTPPGSKILIGRSVEQGKMSISIKDNGYGFPEDKLGLVFQKFYRLPNTRTGGTGLGLSIAQGFAKAHNGQISLKNLPEGGAEFIIEIPCEINYYKTTEDETR
ncbi:sensor histidine kinase [Christiangramia fulva]|uniref:sensor histidine kinase n=1 Tax=Christiangramia fulva TaxID=2126553 RepID=UPI001D04E464|nr:ATP-binding protein [Christiangramia fulva]